MAWACSALCVWRSSDAESDRLEFIERPLSQNHGTVVVNPLATVWVQSRRSAPCLRRGWRQVPRLYSSGAPPALTAGCCHFPRACLPTQSQSGQVLVRVGDVLLPTQTESCVMVVTVYGSRSPMFDKSHSTELMMTLRRASISRSHFRRRSVLHATLWSDFAALASSFSVLLFLYGNECRPGGIEFLACSASAFDFQSSNVSTVEQRGL